MNACHAHFRCLKISRSLLMITSNMPNNSSTWSVRPGKDQQEAVVSLPSPAPHPMRDSCSLSLLRKQRLSS